MPPTLQTISEMRNTCSPAPKPSTARQLLANPNDHSATEGGGRGQIVVSMSVLVKLIDNPRATPWQRIVFIVRHDG